MTSKPPPKQRAKPDAAGRIACIHYEMSDEEYSQRGTYLSAEARRLADRIRRAIKAAEKRRDATWHIAIDTAQNKELARIGAIRHPSFILDDIMSRMKGTP